MNQIELIMGIDSKCSDYYDAMDFGYNENNKLFKKQSKGIFLGKLIQINVCDGYEFYYISEIKSNFVKLKNVSKFSQQTGSIILSLSKLKKQISITDYFRTIV
jgi:hypothetical protein